MSHSYEDVSGVSFNFDQGLEDGDLTILVPQSRVEKLPDGKRQVTIPVQAILELVAHYHVAPKRIRAIEEADTEELLR